MADSPQATGRGMVITGSVITVVSLLITGAAVAYFVTGMISSPEAMSMVFPFLLIGWLTFAMPTWFIGVPVLGLGRARQRGPVKGAKAAWVVTLAGLPTVAVLLFLTAASGASVAFNSLIVAIPIAIVAMIGGVAWLVWGKPADHADVSKVSG